MGSHKPHSAVDSLPVDYTQSRGPRREQHDPLGTTDSALVIPALTDEERAKRRAVTAGRLLTSGAGDLTGAFGVEDLEVYRFDPDLIVAEMPAILDWARTNGLTPEYIPTSAVVVIEGDWLTVDTFVDADGNPGRAQLAGGVVRVGAVTVPLIARPRLASLIALAVPKAKPAGPLPPAPPSSVPCPECPGRIGEPCISSKSGKPWNGYHTARRRKANQEKGAAA